MQDPYSILGISPSASEDDIKKAYRTLAKKYHPDVNGGSAEAEQKMKEINEAYTTVMKMRRDGTSGYAGGASGGYSSGGAGNGYGGYNSYGGYNGSYGGNGGFDPFRDFAGFGGYGYGSQNQQSSRTYTGNPLYNAARNYINSGHYREALNTLEGMNDRTAEWYYLMGYANLGIGNRTAALNYARQAVSMEPSNLEYRVLLSRMEGNTNRYRNDGEMFNAQQFICGNPLLMCCLMSCLCNCCCGGFGGGYRF